MKFVVTILCLLIPVAVSAQNPNMQGVDMQKMMQAMQEMQQCMAKVDQKELNKLQAESEQFQKEIEALCAEGKRDKAQKKAIKYSKQMMKNPAMKQMKECGEITKGLLPEGAGGAEEKYDYDPDRDGHVCDN